jgi:hypothetical protein
MVADGEKTRHRAIVAAIAAAAAQARLMEVMMPTVSVKKLDDSTFEVTVNDRSPTTHIVTVAPDYADKLTQGSVPVEKLVARSFDFLLERESNTSILRRFDLPVIARYFPEYEREIRSMLK